MSNGTATDVSSAGATLHGSWSGATGEFHSMGFKYGTNQSSLTSDLAATLTQGDAGELSATLSGLKANTTYYYKAYVQEYNETTQEHEYRYASTASSFKTKSVATASVTTGSTSSVSSTGATLQGSYSGATGTVSDRGFYWGTSSSAIQSPTTSTQAVSLGSGSSSGSFTGSLSSLSAQTTYYYRAYVVEFDENSNQYVDRLGSILSFTTPAESVVTAPGYLGCYEVPAITNLSGTGTNGNYSDRDDKWYRYNTTNSKRQVATHTFTHPDSGKKVRTYTVLYDESKYAPVWTAHAMHASMWVDKNVGRNDSWTDDPAISLTQQGGLDNANNVGYSRGHLVASNYRQSTVKENKQTFYHSNQAPQWQNSFNDGVWSSLEQDVAKNAPSGRDTLYVVTGVLYEGTIQTKPSGSLNVPIPSHFYKCLMKCSFNSNGQMTAASGCAYVYTNEAHSGMQYSAGITTINAIESRAGFDFFANVPTNLQDAAESQSSPLW